MAFFANSSNFKISGGTFNTIHGDLNQEDHTYSTYVSDSYNNYSDNSYPDDIPNNPYYHQHAPWPPRGRYPPQQRSQRRHQEHGPYGYAEYYDDRQSQSTGYYDGGYEPQGAPSHFETSLRSSERHIEITGGEFMATRGRNATQHYHRDVEERFTQESEGSTPTSSQIDSLSDSEQENPDPDLPSDIPMLDEEGVALQNSATAVPASIPEHMPSAKKPLTTVERMRMAMADMEIEGTDQAEAVNTAPAPAYGASERKQRSTQSFTGKMFPFRPKPKP